jgi:hypothetical protein
VHLEEGREVARTRGRTDFAIADMVDGAEGTDYKELAIIDKSLRKRIRKRGWEK